jgi:site-specific recombinase XerD
VTDYTIEDFLASVGATVVTVEQYRRCLRSCETWAGKPLGRLTFADVDRLKTKLRGMLSGPHYATVLRMFFDRAGMADHRKRALLKQRLKRLRPEDILTVAEVQRIIDSTNTTRDRAFLAVLYETGVRVGELMAVDLEHVRHKKSNGGPEGYVIWFGKVKVAGEEHRGFVYESAPVLESWLKAHPDQRPGAPLFCSYNRRRMDRKGAWNIVEGAAKRAKIGKRVYPHLFRHSRATHLLQRGTLEHDVKKLLGWKPGSLMLSRYSHLSDEDAERAALKAGGFTVPEKVDIGQLDFPDERLRPVVPVSSPPGVNQETITLQELASLLADPEVQRFLRLLETARQPPPA